MGRGGFDAVIGNPPYGATFLEATNEYLKKIFFTYVWRGESYLCFVEKAVKSLKLGGMLGYIVPDTYLNLGFTHSLRTFLLRNTKIKSVVLLPSNVFGSVAVDTTLLFAQRFIDTDTFHEEDVLVRTFNKRISNINLNNPDREFLISTKLWYEQNAFNVFSDKSETELIYKISKNNKNLSEFVELFYGIKAYQIGKGKPPQTKKIRDNKPFTSERQIDETFLPFFDGKHIGRYELLWNENNWVKYGPWLAEPRVPGKFEGEKILIRKIVGKTLIATYIQKTSYCNTLLYVLKINENYNIDYRYLLGILNSKFIGWYFRKRFQISDQDTFPQILIRDILQIPIPTIKIVNHDKLVLLVQSMLDLHKRLSAFKTGHEKTLLQRQIEIVDQQIERLVYDLYELTEEDIMIVEASAT
jgi:hypothetical protein